MSKGKAAAQGGAGRAATQGGGAKGRGQHRGMPPGRAWRSAARDEREPLWLYGVHAVQAALANPRRRKHRLLLTAEAAQRLEGSLTGHPAVPRPETVERAALDQLLPEGAVHQGVALLAEPLPGLELPELVALSTRNGGRRPLILALDQVTDPQNVGAILRSCAAFGATGLLTTERHAARHSGALAKAASGGLELVPWATAPNLARALESFKRAGFWVVGLSEGGSETLAAGDPGGPLVLVLGAEGEGLRRLTRDSCDLLLRLPTSGPVQALNVSTAAAVALYQLLALEPPPQGRRLVGPRTI